MILCSNLRRCPRAIELHHYAKHWVYAAACMPAPWTELHAFNVAQMSIRPTKLDSELSIQQYFASWPTGTYNWWIQYGGECTQLWILARLSRKILAPPHLLLAFLLILRCLLMCILWCRRVSLQSFSWRIEMLSLRCENSEFMAKYALLVRRVKVATLMYWNLQGELWFSQVYVAVLTVVKERWPFC